MRARTRGHVRGGRCVLASNEGHRGNFESASMGGSVGLSGAGWDGTVCQAQSSHRKNLRVENTSRAFLPLLPSIDASTAEALG